MKPLLLSADGEVSSHKIDITMYKSNQQLNELDQGHQDTVTLCSKSPLKEIETCGYETLVPELYNV